MNNSLIKHRVGGSLDSILYQKSKHFEGTCSSLCLFKIKQKTWSSGSVSLDTAMSAGDLWWVHRYMSAMMIYVILYVNVIMLVEDFE